MAWGVPNEFASNSEDPDFELTQEILLATQSFCLLLAHPHPASPNQSSSALVTSRFLWFCFFLGGGFVGRF